MNELTLRCMLERGAAQEIIDQGATEPARALIMNIPDGKTRRELIARNLPIFERSATE